MAEHKALLCSVPGGGRETLAVPSSAAQGMAAGSDTPKVVGQDQEAGEQLGTWWHLLPPQRVSPAPASILHMCPHART